MDIGKIVTQQAEHPEWRSLLEDEDFHYCAERFRPDPKNIPSHTPLLDDGLWEWALRLNAQAEAWKRDFLCRASSYDEARADFEREVEEAKDTWEWELEWKYEAGLREYEGGERSECPVPPNFNDTAAFSAWKREQDKWHSQKRAQWERVKRLLNAEAYEVGLVVKKAGRRTLWRLLCVLLGVFLSITCIPLGIAGTVAYLRPESPLGVFCMDWILTPALFTVLAVGYIFYSLVTSGPVMWIAAAFGVVFLGMLGNYWAMVLFKRRRARI